MKNKTYRQGDVLIERVTEIPKEAVKQKHDGKIILAHGEATGHHHSIECDAADWWKQDNGDQFVAIPKQSAVVHQEHGAIALPKGFYRVTRQCEYVPKQMPRNVAD